MFLVVKRHWYSERLCSWRNKKTKKRIEKWRNKKRDSAKRANKFRAKEKVQKAERLKNHPAVIKPRPGTKQPPLTDWLPALLETIINIGIQGSTADERRRTKMSGSWLILTDLREAVADESPNFSKGNITLFTRRRFYHLRGEARTCKVSKSRDRDAPKAQERRILHFWFWDRSATICSLSKR